MPISSRISLTCLTGFIDNHLGYARESEMNLTAKPSVPSFAGSSRKAFRRHGVSPPAFGRPNAWHPGGLHGTRRRGDRFLGRERARAGGRPGYRAVECWTGAGKPSGARRGPAGSALPGGPLPPQVARRRQANGRLQTPRPGGGRRALTPLPPSPPPACPGAGAGSPERGAGEARAAGGGARGGRGAARAGGAGGRGSRRRRRRWLSRRWRRRRSGGAPARPSSSSPPRRRSGAWTSTPSPASPSTCSARRPPAATISMCGAKVRTAYLFCNLHRITSPPVGKRHSMKYWKKSSNPSDPVLSCQRLLADCSQVPLHFLLDVSQRLCFSASPLT
uniref:Uncharacterized protein n=1 Tax=Falco tinnunculus TaxID=100819 RepID=A0A8C4TP92_FALTI